MNFKDGLPNYIQIAERLSDEILAGHYVADMRVPGIREYAALLEVNVNTAVKAFDQLASCGILYNKRGLGYFVANEAKTLILETRRKNFFENDVPEFFKQIRLLAITPEELEKIFDQYLP